MRRRTPSEPGFTARSREDAARPASGQLVSIHTQSRRRKREDDVEVKKNNATWVDSDSVDRTHAGDPTLSQAVLRCQSAVEGHFSTGPPTPECGAAGHLQEG